MGQHKSGVKTTSKQQTTTTVPPLFKVVLLNDNYTPMEFVTDVLEQIFRKSPTEANQIMLQIHFRGSGTCGTYPHAIAESKADEVRLRARTEGYPLRAILEEV